MKSIADDAAAGNLSQYIAKDLETRLAHRQVGEASLTLTALGRHYGVSFTPIRSAIDQLLRRQILVRRENGRVAPGPAAGEISGRPLEMPKPPEATDWDHRIGEDLIRRSLLGESDFLREESTAAAYGLGRTVLRQIFHRLSGTGLLTHVPRRGWRVRPFQERDLIDYLEVRETLECLAIRLAAEHTDRASMREILAGNDPQRLGSLDNRLHQYFIQQSGNRYIIDFFARNGGYFTTLMDRAAPETHAVAEMASQHRQVLQHALAGDWAAAEMAMAHHIRSQKPMVLEMIAKIRADRCPQPST
jgi:DNA-binding GntR family transcriptional regulator